MTIDETAERIMRVESNWALAKQGFKGEHLRAMARLWLLLPDIREIVGDCLVRGDDMESRRTKLCVALEDENLALVCEHDWQTFGPNERIEGTMDVCMKCGLLGKSTNASTTTENTVLS